MHPLGSQLDNPISFGQFIRSIESRMIQTTWRITRNQADAEDAIQAALSIAWRRKEVFMDHPNPVALMLKICIDASLDLLKKNRSTRNTLNKFAESSPSPMSIPFSLTPASRLESEESLSVLLSEIKKLPGNLCQAILLRLVDEMPYPDIAAALGCTEVAARKYVQRGREELQTRLRDLKLDPYSGEAK